MYMGDSLVKNHFLLRECYKAPCWTRKKITMKHSGGEPFSPERLLEEILKVSYSGINWNGFKIKAISTE